MVAENAQTTRVFTFGIGNDSDRELCMGMARAGRGKGEIVDDKANINKAVIKQLGLALKVGMKWETMGKKGGGGCRELSPSVAVSRRRGRDVVVLAHRICVHLFVFGRTVFVAVECLCHIFPRI